ncbi:diguanylate cyclase [Oleiagrimonas sp. C23AA]|uniref:diguanylate cyclase n=1 Tax=Oleiagrimonas sp. C23AA TaxID=2719047 RepID=UPI00141D9D11|nr:sensor domain-containing diguanylate cyclase [Oleiagrimonas sp. C23AA]
MQWARAGADAHQGLRYLVLGLVWLLLWRLSALMEYAPHASIWFPPAGLSFAALLLLGWRAVPVLMACAVTVTFWMAQLYASAAGWHDVLLTGLLFGAAHCASYGVGAAVLTHLVRRHVLVSAPAIILTFLLVGCLSALCAALSGIGALQATGMLGRGTEPGLWLPWWVGDMAGALVLTPLFLGLLSWRYPQIEPWLGGLSFSLPAQKRAGFGLKLGISMLLVSVVLIVAAHVPYPEVAFGMFFLILPQMWIVYTESPFRSALSLAIFSTVVAIWVASLNLVDQALTYQFAICVIAASAYFGFAVPALMAQNQQLSELAFSDSLTKAATKSYFFERAEREREEAERKARPLSLIVLDIDHFKAINDTHGHSIGDETLIRLSRAVRVQLGPQDLLGRFGGDEFTLLLPGAELEQAMATAEQLRRLLWHTHVPGTKQHLSASFGVVTLSPRETIMQAFKRADMLLLEAKRHGRNSVGVT